jgi:hypothetical protein
MIYRRTERFKKSFATLPRHIQEKAIKAFSLFKQDPGHPSLVLTTFWTRPRDAGAGEFRKLLE